MKRITSSRTGGTGLVRIALILSMVFTSALALGAQDLAEALGPSDAWKTQFRLAYAAMSQAGGVQPSALALRLCAEEGKEDLSALPPETAARSAYRIAMRAEIGLRFGATPQEARAMIRQRLRIETRQGEKAGKGLEEGSRLMARTQLRQRLGVRSGLGGSGSKGKR